MTLAAGTRLGSYEVLSKLGEGGMGEVYQARDSKLNRNVAIKVLPPTFSADPDRLARFRREAQVLASLNHPNIAAIYGLEDQGDTLALVMELVPGRTLAELIAAPIPLSDALPIARQIAAALEAAHEQGIIHRDLKPANVKITDDGTVKVLDFGLAKALGAPGSAGTSADQANSPTLTSPAMTELGMILGTAGYMAPEQAKGKAVDRRADIWALGVVLFEMLAGRSLYRGETVTETIAHVITQPPDWNALPASTPTPVRKLLRRCLEKDPRNRLQSAGDARIEIDDILSAPTETEAPAAPRIATATPTSGWLRALPWALAGVLLVALGYSMWPRPAEPVRPARLDVLLTPADDVVVDADNDGPVTILSPDGQTLVYLAVTRTSRQLYARKLDQLEATPLAGTENVIQPFFSPDGASLAFFANGQLMRTVIAGGAPTSVAPAALPRGGSWGPNDTIVYAANVTEGLSRVSAAGGSPVAVTMLGPNERTHRWPSILPDGTHVLFMCQTADGAYDDGTIEVARIDTGERKVLIRGGTYPRYVDGYLLYSRRATLYAVRFDVGTLELQGEPQPILSGLLTSGAGTGAGTGNGSAQISVADNGTAAYLTGTTLAQTPLRLVIVDRTGKTVYEFPGRKLFRDPRLSPDGTQIALRIGDGRAEHLHVLDPQRGTLTQITFDGTYNSFPVWTHDGRRLAFTSDRIPGGMAAYLMPSDGTSEAKALTRGSPVQVPTSFSPDDQLLAVFAQGVQSNLDVEIASVTDGTRTPFLNSTNHEVFGDFSPDGKWLTYMLVDSGGFPDIYVRAYPSGGALRKVSTAGGAFPRWTRNGREIVYVDTDGKPTAVDVSPDGDALRLGNPHRLFDLAAAQVTQATSFDASADGNRFVLLLQDTRPTSRSQRTHVTLIFNFLEELRRATK